MALLLLDRKLLYLIFSMHITTYNLNSGTSMNFIQEYANITYMYLQLALCIFNMVYVNFIYLCS
jgi:hypothetical protein